jgi:hypothetical protein
MGLYYVSTDSASQEIEASTADLAAEEFARGEDAPRWVKDVASLERWLVQVGGYGFIETPDGPRIFDVRP